MQELSFKYYIVTFGLAGTRTYSDPLVRTTVIPVTGLGLGTSTSTSTYTECLLTQPLGGDTRLLRKIRAQLDKSELESELDKRDLDEKRTQYKRTRMYQLLAEDTEGWYSRGEYYG